MGAGGAAVSTSAREAALAALFGVVQAAVAARNPAPGVLRNETVPQRLPAGGLVVLLDGETLEAEPVLGLGHYWMRHQAVVEIHAPGASDAARRALCDALLRDISAAVMADTLLGGAVDGAEALAAVIEDSAIEGGQTLRSAAVPVDLYFSAATPNS